LRVAIFENLQTLDDAVESILHFTPLILFIATQVNYETPIEPVEIVVAEFEFMA
jgi:hypothetical protein